MISANDAAVALAQATGSYAKGMALINAEAHHLQAYDTVAVRPNGLDAPGQHVSAYDEALFARQALAVPAFMHDESAAEVPFPAPAARDGRHHPRWVTLWTQNTMLVHVPGRSRRQDRLDHPGRGHVHRLGPARAHHPGGDHPALHPADRADRRLTAAELGFRHGWEGQAGRAPGQPAARRDRSPQDRAEPGRPPQAAAADRNRICRPSRSPWASPRCCSPWSPPRRS